MKSNLPDFSDLEKEIILAYLQNPNVKCQWAHFKNPAHTVIVIQHSKSHLPTAIGVAKTKRLASIAALESLRRRFNNAKT